MEFYFFENTSLITRIRSLFDGMDFCFCLVRLSHIFEMPVSFNALKRKSLQIDFHFYFLNELVYFLLQTQEDLFVISSQTTFNLQSSVRFHSGTIHTPPKKKNNKVDV